MPEQVPEELSTWVAERVDLLSSLVDEIKRARDQGSDPERWTLALLDGLSNVEQTSRRTVHLLTAWSVRTRTLSTTTVAKATNITITAAQSRVGSRLAEAAWSEVWPSPAAK
jgi:hypothetical protein